MEYFHHPKFDVPEEHAEILREVRIEDGVLPDKDQEFHLFRQMNFYKHLAAHAANDANKQASLAAAQSLRNQLVTMNMRLAKRGSRIIGKRLGIHYSELIGEANLSLLIAVDKFNYNKGFKFSTYALWVILRRFSRSKETLRSKVADPALLGRLPDMRESETDASEQQEQNKKVVNRILERLDPRKRKVIRELLGLDGIQFDAVTLGRRMKITDERVRQLRNRGFEILQGLVSSGELALDNA